MTMKQMPLLETMKEIGVDILYGLDPVQGGTDLPLAKKLVGDRVCLWGGMNSAITLNHGTPEEIRRSAKLAIQTLAPGGGFIFSSIDQVFEDTPWRNIEIMIDTWKSMSNYPVH
jgi:uroporphyrinogen decarboxylase